MFKEAIIPILLSTLLFDDSSPKTEAEINQLETEIRQDLDMVPFEVDFNATFVANNGRTLSHSVGDVSLTTPLRSASTSKWVTSSIILWFVQTTNLTLSDTPQKYIDFWPTTGELSEITLQQLLSFTSGLNESALCINFGFSNFENCVETILENNQINIVSPNTEFYYESSHMQVAGLMAIKALNVETWQDVVTQFNSETSLFQNSTFSLPSQSNPRLAGGMVWIASDYLEFLDKLYKQEFLNADSTAVQRSNNTIGVTIANSPSLDVIGEDWRYGLGLWLECQSAQYNCNEVTRISSPGAYGAYPFIDIENQYYGLVAREGELGSFDEGYAIWQSVEQKLESWAALNR